MKLVLASASPRRRELLSRAGVEFRVMSADIDESVRPQESSVEYVRRLACEKAYAVLSRLTEDEVSALGADTTVVVDREVLGKPADDDDARRMLRMLSGREHEVTTGVCLLTRRRGGTVTTEVNHATTVVRFRAISSAEIDAYIATGEPRDKAGAYAIQSGAAKFVDGYEGDHDNVVGLPVALVLRMLSAK